jgi:hypothetical protein
MGLNAVSEFGQRNADVTRITRNAARVQRQTLMRVLDRAKEEGELSSDADLDSMGDFFDCTLAGMRMAAKAGKSRKALRNIAILAEERIADYRLLDLCRSHTNGLARYGIAPEYAEGGRSYRLERTAIFPLPINEAVLGLPLFASKEFWAARTSLECLLVHWYSAVIGASSVSPSFVNEYSTPTGDSVRTRRATSPLRSSCRKHCVSIFCEMPGTPRFNTLKRALPS